MMLDIDQPLTMSSEGEKLPLIMVAGYHETRVCVCLNLGLGSFIPSADGQSNIASARDETGL